MPISNHSPSPSTHPCQPPTCIPLLGLTCSGVFLLLSEQLFFMIYEEGGGPMLWIFLEGRQCLRASFLEEVEAGPSAGHVRLPLSSCPPQATHHHPQCPPAVAAAAGQRQQLRVPAAATGEVSRWGSRRQQRRKLQFQDAKAAWSTVAVCRVAVLGGGAADGHVRCSWGEERTGYWASVMGQELLREGAHTPHLKLTPPCELGLMGLLPAGRSDS